MIRFRVKFNGFIDRCFRATETRDIVPHVPPAVQHLHRRSTPRLSRAGLP
jgi:hypothetical protein